MSRCLHTNPDRIYDDMRSLRPDATLTLEGGRYATPLVLSSVSGSQQQPVVIHGNGAVIDGGGTYKDYRETANRLSAVQEANGRFPGIYYLADNAALMLRNCQWIVIEDLNFEGCWPTAIYLDNCQHITLRRLHIRGSTIAIGAAGPYTRHLLIEACDWIQDLQSHGEADLAAIRKTGAVNAGLDPGDCRLWREISWSQVHGNIEDTNSRVTVETDERGFDGDFFRAWTIAGYVVLRNNVILDAFNGIHFFNDASDSTVEDFCRNIVIENNWFVRIRDNAIEAEDYAWNWTVRGNRFVDSYMPFSLEMHRSGYFYIYGNLGWNRHRPGPDGDDRNFGQLFKFPKQHEAVGPHYVFNNSWMLRGPISKRNRISQFHHLNNAIGYYGTAGLSTPKDSAPFGASWQNVPKPGQGENSLEGRYFTKLWQELDIRFDGDLIDHEYFPDLLRHAGYPIGVDTNPGPVPFRSSAFGKPEELKLTVQVAAVPFQMQLPDGREQSVAGADYAVGAWQGERPFTIEKPMFYEYWLYPKPCGKGDQAES
ncbi:right-handed parallel beta-helix repeat-containing protein [Rhizobium leguminosarum]|uniref:right-handed parallel beta-helix repeat-containing protein n=1 Tax=Rhizobium leguminosarum TaxID=384 RepID=UPI001C95AF8D|nr:right-handed parallel beta-helix repeat-containing protein [Rhizobium leguminosarum]MBY5770580.1 right-handed parallel beta-helix repeat-containing protein [Rhizobium leguminosarum]